MSCLSSQATRFPTYSWEALPQDLLKSILYYELDFPAQTRVACVCKLWHIAALDRIIAQPDLKEAGIHVPVDKSWIKCFRNFIDTPHFIALDVSASMLLPTFDESPFAKGLEQIQHIITSLRAPLKYRGVHCVAFAESCIARRCHTAGDISEFFINHSNNVNTLGRGTRISNLFNKLAQLQNKLQKAAHVTIISDFDDTKMNLEPLLDSAACLNVQCIHVGGAGVLPRLVNEYELWAKSQAHHQHQNVLEEQDLQMHAAPSFTKERKWRKITTSQSAKKRNKHGLWQPTSGRRAQVPLKRERPMSFEYKMPFSLCEVTDGNWQPFPKKRRITIQETA